MLKVGAVVGIITVKNSVVTVTVVGVGIAVGLVTGVGVEKSVGV